MKKQDFVVRKATIADVNSILFLSKECFDIYTKNAGIDTLVTPLKETCESVEKDIKNKEVFVAEFNNEIVGSVRVQIMCDNTAYLSRFGVAALYQNKGIGKLLMDKVDEAMESLNITHLYLHTSSKILSLIKFYYEKGFYIESTNKDCGYIRALLCKEYDVKTLEASNFA